MTTNSANTVVGYFSTNAEAQSAVDGLKSAGFQARDIGVAVRGSSVSTTESAGRAAGKHASGTWEKIKEFFEGDSDRSTSSKNTSGVNATTREAETDYRTYDARDSLSEMAVPERHSRYFGQRFHSGSKGAIVTVSTDDRQEEARTILEEYGADLGSNAADFGEETTDENFTTRPLNEDQNIRLYGEVLRVHKDRVNRGEVRLRKEVRTDTQTVEVPVTREELVVERREPTGDREVSDATFGEQEIRIPLSEERASLDKQAVVTEEVKVGKREVTNVQPLKEQVRREELKVDDTTKSA